MKRSGPLKRGKALQRKTWIARGAPLERRGRVNPISDKRRAAIAKRRQVVEAIVDERGLGCEAGPRIRAVDMMHECDGEAVDPHELRRRSQGGSIVDPANILLVCRSCHRWIGDHPEIARELGLHLFAGDV